MCDECQVKAHHDQLWAVNRDACDLWALLNRRTVVDLGLAPWLIERYATGDPMDIVRRIDMIREIVTPPDGK